MRTPGYVQIVGPLIEHDPSANPDDLPHYIACWNAVEAIGGDPETVGELREALDKMVKSHKHDHLNCHCGRVRAAQAILDKVTP